MGNLGIDYETLSTLNPRLVMKLPMPAFGLSGRLRDRHRLRAGHRRDERPQPLSPAMPDGPPIKAEANFFCDQQAGVLTAFAVCSALRHVERTGGGQHIELAMIEGEFQVLGDAAIDFAMNRTERRRSGNEHPGIGAARHVPLRGEDAWVAIAVEGDSQWATLRSSSAGPN